MALQPITGTLFTGPRVVAITGCPERVCPLCGGNDEIYHRRILCLVVIHIRQQMSTPAELIRFLEFGPRSVGVMRGL